MRIPRDIGAEDLISLLRRYGYESTRHTGSHIRITTTLNGEHHVTVPPGTSHCASVPCRQSSETLRAI
jgi:predicted RNA binding protein YcfA (HicA-like mRNA interferase family)